MIQFLLTISERLIANFLHDFIVKQNLASHYRSSTFHDHGSEIS